MPDLNKEIRDLDAAIDATGDERLADYSGVDLMRGGLLRRRHEVLTFARGSLELVLSRSDSRGEGSELRLVSAVLGSLQESLASIAQVVAGRPTGRGVIPGEIAERVELRVAATAPGSLDLTLVPAFPEEPEQDQLFEIDTPSLLEESVYRLFDVVERAGRDEEELLESVAALGSRAIGHVVAFSKSLADNQAAAALNWRSARNELATQMSAPVAASLFHLLAEAEEDESVLESSGRLVGVSLVHDTFELETEEGVLSGKVANELLGTVEQLFGQPVDATLDVLQLKLKNGQTKNVYRLITVRPSASQLPPAPKA
jgi:hypothetical protein